MHGSNCQPSFFGVMLGSGMSTVADDTDPLDWRDPERLLEWADADMMRASGSRMNQKGVECRRTAREGDQLLSLFPNHIRGWEFGKKSFRSPSF